VEVPIVDRHLLKSKLEVLDQSEHNLSHTTAEMMGFFEELSLKVVRRCGSRNV